MESIVITTVGFIKGQRTLPRPHIFKRVRLTDMCDVLGDTDPFQAFIIQYVTVVFIMKLVVTPSQSNLFSPQRHLLHAAP